MTKTEIANIALAKFREGRITNIESTTDPAAIVVNDQYDHALELVLEEHRWNFAGKRVTLTQLSDDPPFGWDHQYALPSDLIRLKDVNGEDVEASSRLFALEGNKLLTNDDTVTITYVARITDSSLFSPSFVEALSFKLASITCGRLTGDADLAIMLDKQYIQALSKAIHNDTKAAGSRDRNLMQRMMDSASILGGAYRHPSSGSGSSGSASGTVAAHKHELTDLLQTGATDGQHIVWNDTDGVWEAADVTAGGDVSTDAIFDAAGDLIVGTGADAATRLPIGANGLVLKSNGTTAVWDAIAGTGDVVGDASSTDNAVARFDGVTGKAIQNSGVTIDDSGNITANNVSGSNTGDEVQATTTTSGIAEVATSGEINTGTLDTHMISPLGLAGSQLQADVTANNAKVTNATHTGEVTGSTALTVDKTAISGKTLVTAAAGDHILVGDASDTDNLKKVTAQSIADLGGGGASQLSDLSDVNTSTPTNRNVLVADGVDFESRALVEADISDLGSYITASSTDTLTNKTFDANGTGNSISNIDPADLSATGTPSASTYLRGDNTWATVAGGGDVTKVGTPVDNQVGVWTGDGTIEGTTGLTYDGSTMGVTGNITVTGTVDGVDVAARDHNEVTIAASGGRDYVTISGTQQLTLNTVDLTADVSGLLPTGNIADDAVTYAKIQNAVSNNVILGNNAGAGSVVDELTAAEVRTIINVEDGADVTDSTNVVSALDSAVLTDAGTPAATDQVLIKDAGTGALQTADFSDFGGGGGGLTLVDKTADANITAVAGEMHVVDMTAFTISRNWTLPVAASVSTGDQFGLMIKTGDTDYEVNVRTGAAADLLNGVDISSSSKEWELFQTGEVIIVTCIDGTTGDYIVEYDGRKPCSAKMSITSTPAALLGNAVFSQIEYDTEEYNNGMIVDVTTNHVIKPRRDGRYMLTSHACLSDALFTFTSSDYFYLALFKNGANSNELQLGCVGGTNTNQVVAHFISTHDLLSTDDVSTRTFINGTSGSVDLFYTNRKNYFAATEIL